MKTIITLVLTTLLTFTNANAAAPDVPAGEYTTDHAHSTLVFRLSHMSFSNYTAQFKQFDAKLNLDPAHPENAKLEVTIDPRSLDLPTPPAGFKDELLGKNWLDTAAFPQITFKSTKIEVSGNNAKITGNLTLHGVTKPIVLDAVFNGGWKGLPGMDPNARAGFSAHGTFKRSDFGVSYGIPQPGSNMGVGDEVSVTIETEFKGPALPAAK